MIHRAGQQGGDWGYLLPPLSKPTPDVGKDQAGSGPAGRQTGLAKLPITSQKFQGPPGVAPPQLAPLPAGHPRQQVLTAPLPFHPVTGKQMKGWGRADPGPGTWRSIWLPGVTLLLPLGHVHLGAVPEDATPSGTLPSRGLSFPSRSPFLGDESALRHRNER